MPSTLFRMVAGAALGMTSFAVQAGLPDFSGGEGPGPVSRADCLADCGAAGGKAVADSRILRAVHVDAPTTLMLLGVGLLLLRYRLRRSGLAD